MTRSADDFLATVGIKDDADPITFAAEAAFAALDRPGLDAEHTARRAMRGMPKTSTKFERGIAFGLALALSACLAGCGVPPEDNTRSVRTDNPSFDVERLFEVDGCRVYRFRDGSTRYFTTCSGSTHWTQQSGKSSVQEAIPTAGDRS